MNKIQSPLGGRLEQTANFTLQYKVWYIVCHNRTKIGMCVLQLEVLGTVQTHGMRQPLPWEAK